ncbi:hypothetical protein C7H19_16195 [Aphanothece hegewaldii CCALA 016]|uniref:DUF1350 domain-containing protein n=1 Tax=Aphanothece hegewaldii CCALA 016 TaxID=2107694 RepID=A0A2T1LVE3_9CHRO|nr:DUF1350 family protein [Aphanothece hegewaldii]PSF35551.1 hypothetical protein C7H19_16195 [Aphanothece hegewaldii CCALA 016]
METVFKFRPISFSWVALHPQPKGVILFIGGAFFGTFPTLFYQYFFERLFDEGYTIVAMPFRFGFRHWPIAISLLKEQIDLREKIAKMADYLNRTEQGKYDAEIYRNPQKYFWIGHSLGCKYITLLEFFSGEKWESILTKCAKDKREGMLMRIERSVNMIPLEERSIKGQPSLLIAPDISDTQSAIPKPLAFIAKFLDKKGWGVLPTNAQTKCFVEGSILFQLTGLISFEKDTIAGNEKDKEGDVFWFIGQLKSENKKFPILHKELPGKHLEPLGSQLGEKIVDFNPFDKFAEPISQRKLEDVTIQFLYELRQREEMLR